MPTNPAITAYIAKAQPFAQPILNHIRELVHKTCPEVEEKIKWGMPFFDYKGPMCNLAAFKQHCSFGFWKASLMSDPILVETAKSEVAMGHLGKITSLKDLPSDKKIMVYIKEAMQLNEDRIKVVKARPTTTKTVVVPDYFTAALKENEQAKSFFNTLSPSGQREYINWLEDAKTEVTRTKRMTITLANLTENKPHNWQYAVKK